MDQNDLIKELAEFLNETGNWFAFLDFADSRGYDSDEVEKAILEAERAV